MGRHGVSLFDRAEIGCRSRLPGMRAAAIARLRDVQNDSFDRLPIAQAISEPLRLLTTDEVFGQNSDLVEIF